VLHDAVCVCARRLYWWSLRESFSRQPVYRWTSGCGVWCSELESSPGDRSVYLCMRHRPSGEDRRETAKRKTKKEDARSSYGARGKEDQLRGTEERSTEPGRMVPSSLEPALGQSTQRRSTTPLLCCYLHLVEARAATRVNFCQPWITRTNYKRNLTKFCEGVWR